jgi:hypothetical protein
MDQELDLSTVQSAAYCGVMINDPDGLYDLTQLLLEQRRAEAALQRLVVRERPRADMVRRLLSASQGLIALAVAINPLIKQQRSPAAPRA